MHMHVVLYVRTYMYYIYYVHVHVMSRGGVFVNFSCGSKVIHETIARKRNRDLRSVRSLATRYVASRYYVACVRWSMQP